MHSMPSIATVRIEQLIPPHHGCGVARFALCEAARGLSSFGSTGRASEAATTNTNTATPCNYSGNKNKQGQSENKAAAKNRITGSWNAWTGRVLPASVLVLADSYRLHSASVIARISRARTREPAQAFVLPTQHQTIASGITMGNETRLEHILD